MNKPDLITKIAHDHGCTKIEAKKIIEYFTDSVSDALLHHDNVSLSGFGNFEVIATEGKLYRHPQTGELKMAAKRRRIRFRPAGNLEDAVQ